MSTEVFTLLNLFGHVHVSWWWLPVFAFYDFGTWAAIRNIAKGRRAEWRRDNG